MTVFASLTNRIFFATAALAVLSIGVAIYNVNAAVTEQAEQELRRGLDEAGTLVDEYRRLLFEHFSREARLVADLPRLKAAVALADPPTVLPIAEEYQLQLDAALLILTDPAGQVLAEIAAAPVAGSTADLPAIREAALGREATSFRSHPGGILQVVSVPVWIDPAQPEILGTLSVGFSLDNPAAERFRRLTNSEIAFAMDGHVHASTLPQHLWSGIAALLVRDGLWPAVALGDEDYVAMTRPLAGPAQATAVILRSRTERLQFLGALHRTLGITALVAVLAATLLSYGIARTVTRPLGTITATMREMAATGDLTRRIEEPAPGWQDEDARVLATAFNRLTASIERFQREAAQRERLSSLGRLSTVIAHEIRNPLMIIKVALRTLRQPAVAPATLTTAVEDIEGEVARLNRIVTEVLDFAKPLKFAFGPADVNALCADAARATLAEPPPLGYRLDLAPDLPHVVTDGERLRLALVNVLTNARHAILARGAEGVPGEAVVVRTAREQDRLAVEVHDRGIGIAGEDLPKVFDPYFTTRRAGTGLGLAISRNIVEGLGGVITVRSEAGVGTMVRIELPSA
jgi:signal transduction histidine kinase